MLGKHSDEYPRFRDCFAGKATNNEKEFDQFGIPKKKFNPRDKFITIYTRTGGANREDYVEDNKKLTEMPEYVIDYDDDFDTTFAYWVFKVPPEFENDYDILTNPENPKTIKDTSEAYKRKVLGVYPKLMDKLKEHLY